MHVADISVLLAGVMGAALAVAHGFVMQRRMITPLKAHMKATRVLPKPLERLVAPLLHVSTLAWFLGGVALILASWRPLDPLRPVVMVIVGLFYLYAAIANALATRGRHFGWVVMAIAVLLLVFAWLAAR